MRWRGKTRQADYSQLVEHYDYLQEASAARFPGPRCSNITTSKPSICSDHGISRLGAEHGPCLNPKSQPSLSQACTRIPSALASHFPPSFIAINHPPQHHLSNTFQYINLVALIQGLYTRPFQHNPTLVAQDARRQRCATRL